MIDSTSKQAAINVLNSMKFDVKYCTEYEKGYNDGIDFALSLFVLLTEQPEQKIGKWIITSEFEDCYYAKCNQCNTTQVFYFNKPTTNYCPECGAKMVERRKE